MKLQDLDLNEHQIKAFFLGAKVAIKPLPFDVAVDDLISEHADSKAELLPELKKLWESDLHAAMFPENKDLFVFLETAKEQIDFFLTALSLAGSNPETIEDEDFVEFIEELEEVVADLDEYLGFEHPSKDEGVEFKDFILGIWDEFVGGGAK